MAFPLSVGTQGAKALELRRSQKNHERMKGFFRAGLPLYAILLFAVSCGHEGPTHVSDPAHSSMPVRTDALPQRDTIKINGVRPGDSIGGGPRMSYDTTVSPRR
jgi:hypothetical protein